MKTGAFLEAIRQYLKQGISERDNKSIQFKYRKIRSSRGDGELSLWLKVDEKAIFWYSSREPWTSHVNQEYREASGFRDYLLNPRPVDQCLGCRLKEQTAANLFDEIRQPVGRGIVAPPMRSTWLPCGTRCKSPPRENQCCGQWRGWSPGPFPVTSGCFHRCSSPPHHHLHLLYVVKPAAGRNLPQEWTPRLGSKVEALACQSQRSSARWYQSSSFGFNPPPPPGVGLLQQVSMFQLCPCVSSCGRHGSRLVPPGRAAFQPPLSVIHLYIIHQGPAHKDSWWPSGLDAVALRCLPTRRFTPTRGR